MTEPLASLLQTFRNAVLDLDPCVSEEFMKVYVAYKAETNFVDVVPKKEGLRLMVNMPFPEVIDPSGRCEDVRGVGLWGNGEVALVVTGTDDLPHALGIVRQSLDRQMDEST